MHKILLITKNTNDVAVLSLMHK